jgi:RimJ/RimL family protein N-acetyltransferase
VTYAGSLVRLRAVEPEDADAHHRWVSDPDVTRYLAWRYPIALSALRARIAAWPPPSYSDVRFSVERLGLHRAELWVFAEHAAAVQAYQRAGFVTEGRARDKMFKGGAGTTSC